VSGKTVAAGVIAGAAAVAAGVAASKSGNESEELPPVQTEDFRTETDVVATETVSPVEVDVVPTPVEDHPAEASIEDDAMLVDGTETYPVADDPAPFNDATGDQHPDGGNRTI
jgi:hypothetical protein